MGELKTVKPHLVKVVVKTPDGRAKAVGTVKGLAGNRRISLSRTQRKCICRMAGWPARAITGVHVERDEDGAFRIVVRTASARVSSDKFSTMGREKQKGKPKKSKKQKPPRLPIPPSLPFTDDPGKEGWKTTQTGEEGLTVADEGDSE